MSDFQTLSVQKRNSTGKGANRRLRAAGMVPAIVYTPGGENITVQVAEGPLHKVFTTLGRTTVFNVEVVDGSDTKVYQALLWDIDFHPTKNKFYHVDFFAVDLEKELKVRVPIEFVGTAKGTKVGGSLETFLERMDILCKPLSLPNKITVDISEMDLGQIMRIKDIALPEGVRSAMDGNLTVISVSAGSGKADAEAEEEK